MNFSEFRASKAFKGTFDEALALSKDLEKSLGAGFTAEKFGELVRKDTTITTRLRKAMDAFVEQSIRNGKPADMAKQDFLSDFASELAANSRSTGSQLTSFKNQLSAVVSPAETSAPLAATRRVERAVRPDGVIAQLLNNPDALAKIGGAQVSQVLRKYETTLDNIIARGTSRGLNQLDDAERVGIRAAFGAFVKESGEAGITPQIAKTNFLDALGTNFAKGSDNRREIDRIIGNQTSGQRAAPARVEPTFVEPAKAPVAAPPTPKPPAAPAPVAPPPATVNPAAAIPEVKAAKPDASNFFRAFKTQNTSFHDAVDALGKELSSFKRKGGDIDSNVVANLIGANPNLQKNLEMSYAKYVLSAEAQGISKTDARKSFIAGIVKALPERLGDDQLSQQSTYRIAARYLEENLDKNIIALRKSIGIAAITEKLSDLKPGKFGRDQLDTRLTALSDTAKQNGLLDEAVIRLKGDLKPKQAEEALLRGEPINSKEMASLKSAKQGEFDEWEKAKIATEIKNKQKAEGKVSPWTSLLTTSLKWPVGIAASLLTVGGIALGVNRFLDGKVVESVHNASQTLATNTAVAKAKAKQEDLAQLQRTCAIQGGEAGEVTNQCIIPRFSDKFTSLSQVFSATGMKEAERVYVSRVADKLQIALDKSAGNVDTFNKLAADYRVEVIKGLQKDPIYKDHLPDFEVVDSAIERALINDPKFALNFR